MVTCLTAVASLEWLKLGFQSPRSRPDRLLPPLARTVLPTLTTFHFRGANEYSEDFISRVNPPLLKEVDIRLFHQLLFDVSQLHLFIRHSETLSALNIANVVVGDCLARLELSRRIYAFSRPGIRLSILCNESGRQISFLAQVCNALSPTLSTFESIKVGENVSMPLGPGWAEDIESSQWLELFHPFTSVKNLYLSTELAPLVASALQQPAEEGVTEVLPLLQNIYLEELKPLGPSQEGIGQFVAARQLFNRPVAVTPWDRCL